MDSEVFGILILIGRPAAGKSEVIDFLKKVPVEERKKRFHIGEFVEIDDFPYVWEMFEADEFLSKHGKERLFTDEKLYFKDPFIWNLLIEKINRAFARRRKEDPELGRTKTAIIEFSRGGERGFEEAFSYLDDDILSQARVMYIKVSYEESLRKNRRRFKPEEADSILFHSLPDEKMEFYYKTNDWEKLSGGRSEGYFAIRGYRIPFAVLENEPEVTDDPQKLGPALEETLGRLWRPPAGTS